MSSVVQLSKGKASSAGSSPGKGKLTPFTASASLASASFTKNLLGAGPAPIAARPEWGTGSALQSTWIQRLIPVSRSFKHAEEASQVRNGLTRQVGTMDSEEDTSGDGEAGSEELQSLEGCAVFEFDRKNGIHHKYDKHPHRRALNSQAEKPNMVKCVRSSSIRRSTNPDSCRTVECTDQIKPSTSLMASKVKLPKAACPRHERSITLGKSPASSDPKFVVPVADARTHGQASTPPFKPAEKTHVVISPDRLVSSVWFARIAGKDGAASRAATHFVKSSDFCRNLNGPEENMNVSGNKAIRFFPPLKSGEQWPGTPKPSGLTPLRIPWSGKSGRGNGQDVPEELPLLTPINVPLELSGETERLQERLQVRGTGEVERTPSLVRSFSLFESLEEPRQASTSSCTWSLPSEFINDLYSKNHGAHRHEGKSSPVSVANQSTSSDTKTLFLDSLPLDGDAACANNSLEGASCKNLTDSMRSNKNEIIEEKCLSWSGPDSKGNRDTAEPSKLRVTSFQFSCLDDLPKRHERNEFKIAARPLKTALEAELLQRELGTTQTILEANSKQVQGAEPAFVNPTGVPCSTSVTVHKENNVLRPQGSQQWLQRWSSPNCNSQRLKVLEQAKESYRTGK